MWGRDDRAGVFLVSGRRGAVQDTKEGTMSSRITFSRFVGLIVVVAALSSGTAGASTTPQGLKADGLRWQGIAARYQQLQSPSAASFYTQDALAAWGQRLEETADAYRRLDNAPAASFYSKEALKAAGLRWQAIADSYAGRSSVGSTSSGFDWGAAFIGAASMLGLAMAGAALLIATRRSRRTKIAV